MMQQWWGEGGLDRTLLPWQLCCSSPHATIDCSRMAYLEKYCFLCCTVHNENSVQTIQTTHLDIHSSGTSMKLFCPASPLKICF